MSELENTTVTTPEEQTAPEQERTFTQHELDAIVKDRLSREKSKYADYEELKAKATKFDEYEEANKTELQKVTEKAQALEAELNGIKKAESIRVMREKVAKEAGIPLASMSLITGETEDACMEQAKTILSMMAPGTYPTVPDGGEIHNTSKTTARDAFSQWANLMNN